MPIEETFSDQSREKKKGKKVTVRVIIEGRVVKVGMRYWLKQKAINFNVTGWTRVRLANKTVEALFHGFEDDVHELVKLCHQGPSYAMVKRVKVFPQTTHENLPPEFSIYPSI